MEESTFYVTNSYLLQASSYAYLIDYLPYKIQPTITPIIARQPIKLVIMMGKLLILRPYSTQIIPATSQ